MKIIKEWCGCEWSVSDRDELMTEMVKCCDKVESHKLQWAMKQVAESQRKKHDVIAFVTPFGTSLVQVSEPKREKSAKEKVA